MVRYVSGMAPSWSLVLPAPSGAAPARAAIEAVCAEARRRGLPDPKVRGFAAPPFPRADFYAHLLGGGLAWGLGLFLPLVGLLGALGGLGSVLAVRLGWHGLARFPRVPGWTVILRPVGPDTRRVVAGALDRAAPVRFEAEIVATALSVELLQFAFDGPWWCGPVALVAGALGVFATSRVGLRGDPVATVDTLLELTAGLGPRQDVAVVLCTGTAEAGTGVRAFLDWWGLEGAEVFLVGSPVARAGLGARVRELPPDPAAVLAALT